MATAQVGADGDQSPSSLRPKVRVLVSVTPIVTVFPVRSSGASPVELQAIDDPRTTQHPAITIRKLSSHAPSAAGRAAMQFLQPRRRDLGRRAHHQILALLVQREQDHLADVRLVGEQHHDAVDAWRRAAMRRSAVAEGVQHAAEPCFHFLRLIAGDLEGAHHDVRADGCGSRPDDSSMPLHTMSYWNALMVSGSWVFSASSPPCGMLNGLWLKSICLVSSFSSYIGKSVIQQNRNAPFSISPRSLPSRVRTSAGEFRRLVALAGGEEHRIAGLQRRTPRGLPRRASGSRLRAIGPFGAVRVVNDIAEPAGALGARPIVQLVEEAARLAAPRPAPGSRARCRPTPRSARTARSPSRQNAAVTSAIRSGLRRSGLSVPNSSIAVSYGMRGNGAGVTARPSANSSNTPAITGSIVANTSSCVT